MLKAAGKRIGEFILKQSKHPESVKRKTSNLSAADRILVLFAPREEREYDEALKFVEHLKREEGVFKVDALFYINRKRDKVPALISDKCREVKLIASDDLNWYLKPKSEISAVLEKKYDLLLDISLDRCLPLRFIALETEANTKVSRSFKNAESIFDLTLNIGDDKSVTYLAEQMEKYLLMIGGR